MRLVAEKSDLYQSLWSFRSYDRVFLQGLFDLCLETPYNCFIVNHRRTGGRSYVAGSLESYGC
jgi:hypothetical protein